MSSPTEAAARPATVFASSRRASPRQAQEEGVQGRPRVRANCWRRRRKTPPRRTDLRASNSPPPSPRPRRQEDLEPRLTKARSFPVRSPSLLRTSDSAQDYLRMTRRSGAAPRPARHWRTTEHPSLPWPTLQREAPRRSTYRRAAVGQAAAPNRPRAPRTATSQRGKDLFGRFPATPGPRRSRPT